jgi:hypothetical protein
MTLQPRGLTVVLFVRQAGDLNRIVHHVTGVPFRDVPEPPQRPQARRWERSVTKKLREPKGERLGQTEDARRGGCGAESGGRFRC